MLSSISPRDFEDSGEDWIVVVCSPGKEQLTDHQGTTVDMPELDSGDPK